MRLNSLLSLGLLLAIASTSALAFQEQGGAAAPQPQTAAPVAPQGSPEAGLAGGTAAKPSSTGTEVRIPGLGRLGVLPKMDFGLELLYGASEPKPAEDERDVPADDLTIRGSIKHPF